jgi:DNA-directed RNA polymerase beta' subunit
MCRFPRKRCKEARELMLASKNLLKPADGEPIISPSKDMVLGVYYLTMKHKAAHKGDGRAFADMDEVEMAICLIRWKSTPRSNCVQQPGMTMTAPPAEP